MAYPVYPIIVWHPYPKEKPKEHKQYLVTVLFNGEPYVDFDDYFSHGWDDWKEDEVMAWAEKPSPYEPQTENPCDGCVCDDGKHLMYCMNCKGIAWKTEPPKDEPQTESPCGSRQEFDCYGCEYKQIKRSE